MRSLEILMPFWSLSFGFWLGFVFLKLTRSSSSFRFRLSRTFSFSSMKSSLLALTGLAVYGHLIVV